MQVMPFAGVAMALVAFAGARRSLNEFTFDNPKIE